MDLAAPHHDGSPLYVSTQTPSLGETVAVRVRVPHAAGVAAVHLRTIPDGEQEFVAAREVARDDVQAWWQAQLRCHNPVTSYRFLLSGAPATPDGTSTSDHAESAYRWLNGTGLHPRDVPDADDFRLVTFPAPPQWAAGAVVYQVFPDRFARDSAVEPQGEPGGPRTDLPDWALPAAWDDEVDLHRETGPRQVYGGTLEGVREHLDHLVDLGVDVLYLTPFFPARSNHRYDASTFDEVDPILGGDEALLSLQEEAHDRGLRVMGDVTTNHTGDEHAWFRAALADPDGEYAARYVRDEDGEWVSWLGVESLPKLDHSNPALRTAMFDEPGSVIRRWLGPDKGLDAWRVDVANMTGRYRDVDVAHEVARQVRRAVDEVGDLNGTAPLLIAEHTHDHSADALGDGWHGVMNYSGFTRPVWTWLRHAGFAPKFLGSPVRVPRLGADLVAATMREFAAIVPWRTLAHSFTLVGSHDTTRVRTLVGDDGDSAQVEVAAGLLFTMPGIPMLTYGDEIGMQGDFGEDGRKPMPWAARGVDDARWDEATYAAYRTLIKARRSTPALHSGGLRWLHAQDDALVFLREHPEGSALVHVARDAHAQIRLRGEDLPEIVEGHPLVGSAPLFEEGSVLLEASGPRVAVWLWQPPVPEWA